MLGEYKVNRCTRQCHALDRPLREGEWYYSVVLASKEEYVRRDYSAEGWQGPPEEAIGWWKNRMPTSDEKKLVLAPPEVLIDLLRQMEQFPEKAKSRYLLALMLMRRKIVRPVPLDDEDSPPNASTADEDAIPEGRDEPENQVETENPNELEDQVELGDQVEPENRATDDESPLGEEIMRVEVVVDGSTIDVPVCTIRRGESDALRDELNELLYCEAEPELDTDSGD